MPASRRRGGCGRRTYGIGRMRLGRSAELGVDAAAGYNSQTTRKHDCKSAPVAESSERQSWIDAVHELLETTRCWAEEVGWLVDVSDKEITERALGTYVVKQLTVKTPRGVLIMEPVARRVGGADGRVDLYAFPSLNRVVHEVR